MNPDERARLRAFLGGALRTAQLPDAPPAHPGKYTGSTTPTERLVETFTTRLASLGGQVHEGSDAFSVAAIVATYARAEGRMEVLAWDDSAFPVPGIRAALIAGDLTIVPESAERIFSADHRAVMSRATIGVTGADAALAETASLILASGPGRSRLASLLPPIHVAVVRRASLVWSLHALIATKPELMTSGANVVCISGPSRTADIEHTLSRGVHGPREVHVIFVD